MFLNFWPTYSFNVFIVLLLISNKPWKMALAIRQIKWKQFVSCNKKNNSPTSQIAIQSIWMTKIPKLCNTRLNLKFLLPTTSSNPYFWILHFLTIFTAEVNLLLTKNSEENCSLLVNKFINQVHSYQVDGKNLVKKYQ